MKFPFLLIIGLFSMTILSGARPTFTRGDKVINLGVGFGSGFYSGYGYKTVIPPLSTSFEVGIKKGVIEQGSLGLGGYVAYSTFEESYLTWGVKYKDIIVGARVAFHYPLVKKLDSYAAMVLGYNISSDMPYGDYTADDSYKTHGGITYSFVIGGRYYFLKKVAAFAELGVGITYVNFGMAFKF